MLLRTWAVCGFQTAARAVLSLSGPREGGVHDVVTVLSYANLACRQRYFCPLRFYCTDVAMPRQLLGAEGHLCAEQSLRKEGCVPEGFVKAIMLMPLLTREKVVTRTIIRLE